MTNFHDPKVVQTDARTSAYTLSTTGVTIITFWGSGICQALACDGGDLHVSRSLPPSRLVCRLQ